MTCFAVIAPVADLVGWILVLYASLHQSFDGLSFAGVFPLLVTSAVFAFGVPLLILLHSIVVRLAVGNIRFTFALWSQDA